MGKRASCLSPHLETDATAEKLPVKRLSVQATACNRCNPHDRLGYRLWLRYQEKHQPTVLQRLQSHKATTCLEQMDVSRPVYDTRGEPCDRHGLVLLCRRETQVARRGPCGRTLAPAGFSKALSQASLYNFYLLAREKLQYRLQDQIRQLPSPRQAVNLQLWCSIFPGAA